MVNSNKTKKPDVTKKIISSIRDSILNGTYPINTAIPSEAELIKEFKVSKMTVRKAIKYLVEKGYLVSRKGKATYVTPYALEIKKYSLGENIYENFVVKSFDTSSTMMPNDLAKNFYFKYIPQDWQCFVRLYFEKTGNILVGFSLNWINVNKTKLNKQDLIKANKSNLLDHFPDLTSIAHKIVMLAADSSDKSIFRMQGDFFIPTIFCYYNKATTPHMVRMVKIRPEYFTVFKTKNLS